MKPGARMPSGSNCFLAARMRGQRSPKCCGPLLGRVEGDVAREVALAAVGDRQLARHVELGQGAVEEGARHAGQDPPAHHEVPLRVHEERARRRCAV